MSFFMLWRELAGLRPLVSASGAYVVSLCVYAKVQKIVAGAPQQTHWSSGENYPEFIPQGCCWCGDNLLVSRVEHSFDLGDDRLYGTRGDTICVDLTSFAVKKILPEAYRVLLLSPDRKYLAGFMPTGENRAQDKVDFYAFDATNQSAVLVSSYQITMTETERFFHTPLCWSADSRGVFVNSFNRGAEDTELLYLAADGSKRKSFGSEIYVNSFTPDPQPLVPDKLIAWIYHGESQALLATLNAQTTKIESRVSWDAIREIVRDNTVALQVQNSQIVALSPNGRLVIIQDMGEDVNVNYQRLRQVWAVDLATRKRKNLSQLEQLNENRWCQYGLIVNLDKAEYPDEYLFGVLHCPEALMNPESAEFAAALQSESWKISSK